MQLFTRRKSCKRKFCHVKQSVNSTLVGNLPEELSVYYVLCGFLWNAYGNLQIKSDGNMVMLHTVQNPHVCLPAFPLWPEFSNFVQKL